MKKLILLTSVSCGLILASCGGNEEVTDETTENGTDTVTVEKEESGIAFDGVEKGGYKLYGHTDISPEEAFTTEDMFIEYESTGNFSDKVVVAIDQVCQKAGCWITFKDPKQNDIRVVFRDHFTIPIETASGTEAVLLGALVTDTTSVEMQKHYLDDAKEAGKEVSQEEYDAITEDLIELYFDCESILVKQ